MEIKYLKELSNNPAYRREGSHYEKKLEPISVNEIVQLEQIYNQGVQFPLALRELLFLAGKYCYVLDYGLNDTQQEMQDGARELLLNKNKTIDRPFFVIDVYNEGVQFLFVYLDEGKDDPQIYNALISNISQDVRSWITPLLPNTLSYYIHDRMDELLTGFNPF